MFVNGLDLKHLLSLLTVFVCLRKKWHCICF